MRDISKKIWLDRRTNTIYYDFPTHDFQQAHVTEYIRADLVEDLKEAGTRLVGAVVLALEIPGADSKAELDKAREAYVATLAKLK
ncbi:MAG: hypothetical protein AAFU68_02980 [Pseudomonadota bacterium]